MTPTKFDQANDVLGAGDNKDCMDLHIARVLTPKSEATLAAEREANPGVEPEPGYPGVVSFWKFEKDDLQAAMQASGIYFYTRGHTHTPISLSAFPPFPPFPPFAGVVNTPVNITTLKDINTDIREGKLLASAIGLLWSLQGDKTPEQVIVQCNQLADKVDIVE